MNRIERLLLWVTLALIVAIALSVWRRVESRYVAETDADFAFVAKRLQSLEATQVESMNRQAVNRAAIDANTQRIEIVCAHLFKKPCIGTPAAASASEPDKKP